MARTVGIGIQNFEEIITNNYFYIDKTNFIEEWWESGDSVTLITRPRRFGKTLNISMLEYFFSLKYANRSELFQNFSIWKNEKYQKLQGTYPVISLSFANIKEPNFVLTKLKIYQLIRNLYSDYEFLLESNKLSESDKAFFCKIIKDINEVDTTMALHQLSKFLYQYYGKKVIILLDEYDTPMQEAYIQDFWEELVFFTRSLFNSTFKTNPYLARGMMTGITRVSKESIFSDLNNLKVVTTTSDEYATSFGFTEQEVFRALQECDLGQEQEGVKYWYNGFTFGNHTDIYNPWSVLNFLDTGKYNAYWANTSSNSLIGKLIQKGNKRIKSTFELLLKGETICCSIDEQIAYNQLDDSEEAIYSLLLTSGYLKVVHYEKMSAQNAEKELHYHLKLTNGEVRGMFYNMVRGWFRSVKGDYHDFVKALLRGDVKEMNSYMNRVALETFSFFDTGKKASASEPERFYHGFVLGLIVDLAEDYSIMSNRESGFGRYDVMIEPKNKEKDAFILEFKVHEPEEEHSLKDTVQQALQQIEEKQYASSLIVKGIAPEKIHKYGFAFEGKKVLIG